MTLTDGIKNKLTEIADAIRSKTNKSEELTLEQMASEVESIDTLQGFDFSEIYDENFNQIFNNFYKNAILKAKIIEQDWDTSRTDITMIPFRGDKNLVIVPDLDFTNIKKASNAFRGCFNIEYIGELKNFIPDNDISLLFYQCIKLRKSIKIDCRNVTNLANSFYYCTCLEKIELNNTNNVSNFSATFAYCSSLTEINLNTDSGTTFQNLFLNCYSLSKVKLTSIANVINFTNVFNSDSSLTDLQFDDWKQGNISLTSLNKLSAESVKYIIWHALNGENTLGFENQGATSRILQLHATPYASWEEWKLTKPSVEDCEFLGIDETEITKYGELTWEDIALNVKLMTVAK